MQHVGTSLCIKQYKCSKCTISCICMRWGLCFAFRSLRTCTEWHLSLGLPWGYVGLRVAYVQIRRHHVFRLCSLIGLQSVVRFGYVMSGVLVGWSGSWYILIERESKLPRQLLGSAFSESRPKSATLIISLPVRRSTCSPVEHWAHPCRRLDWYSGLGVRSRSSESGDSEEYWTD